MRKIVIITTTFLVLSWTQTAAAQLYTCTGQSNACTICDFFAMVVKVIGITLKFIVPSAIILAVIAAGVMMMLKQEDPDVWARAKKIMLTAIIGGLVAYGGWLLVSVSLAGMNFANKDTWWKFELVCIRCGDGVVQAGEECEPGLSEVPCDEFCRIVSPPSASVPSPAPTSTPSPAPPPSNIDECYASDGRDLTSSGVSFDIVRGSAEQLANLNMSCDIICSARGQNCIGVGLTNPSVSACVQVVHHIGNRCEISENLAMGKCSSIFSIFSSWTCLELSSPCRPGLEPCGTYTDGQSYVQFSVGETACYCQ